MARNASLASSYHGVTDASALMQPPFEAASPQVRDSMRIIARTESTPHIPISVSPKINANCAAEIKKTLLEMGTTVDGQRALNHNGFSGFKETSPKDYDKIRDLLAR